MVWVKSEFAFRLFACLDSILFAGEVTEMDLLAVDADPSLPSFVALVPGNADKAARIILIR